MSDGFSKSASALIRTPIKRYQRGVGMGSAFATAVQAAPAAAIAPASATARAVHCALLGVRNRSALSLSLYCVVGQLTSIFNQGRITKPSINI